MPGQSLPRGMCWESRNGKCRLMKRQIWLLRTRQLLPPWRLLQAVIHGQAEATPLPSSNMGTGTAGIEIVNPATRSGFLPGSVFFGRLKQGGDLKLLGTDFLSDLTPGDRAQLMTWWWAFGNYPCLRAGSLMVSGSGVVTGHKSQSGFRLHQRIPKTVNLGADVWRI